MKSPSWLASILDVGGAPLGMQEAQTILRGGGVVEIHLKCPALLYWVTGLSVAKAIWLPSGETCILARRVRTLCSVGCPNSDQEGPGEER